MSGTRPCRQPRCSRSRTRARSWDPAERLESDSGSRRARGEAGFRKRGRVYNCARAGASQRLGVSLHPTRVLPERCRPAPPLQGPCSGWFPTVPTAPPVAPGRCCPLVSAAPGCCEPAAPFQLLLLDVLAVRNWKKRMRSCSLNLRGVFSPKPPRISTLSTRDPI